MKKIVLIGLGKVGSLVGRLIQEVGFELTAVDVMENNKLPYKVICGDSSDPEFLAKTFKGQDAVVSCLPFHINKTVATAAAKAKIHYFDLTEDVPTTDYIATLAENADTLFAPQCGLAPGFIAITAADLAKRFDEIRGIYLRVGALPANPSGKLGYAFNWSPQGVVNEYLNDCTVIHNGDVKEIPSMQNRENIYINGKRLEAFSTSGGIGSLCETYKGRTKELNYKTMRYPGHLDMMQFFFNELHMKNRPEEAGEILVNAKPPVDEDVVLVYSAVEGYKNKKLFRHEFVRSYFPKEIAGETERAISWTTACSLVSILELLAAGKIPSKGFLKQESISLESFLSTQAGKHYVT
jgi:saccharopine dehydrogenase-like NADP-dependent oxidoreductase